MSVKAGVHMQFVPGSGTSLSVVPLLPPYLRQILLLFATDYTKLGEQSASRDSPGSHPGRRSGIIDMSDHVQVHVGSGLGNRTL